MLNLFYDCSGCTCQESYSLRQRLSCYGAIRNSCLHNKKTTVTLATVSSTGTSGISVTVLRSSNRITLSAKIISYRFLNTIFQILNKQAVLPPATGLVRGADVRIFLPEPNAASSSHITFHYYEKEGMS